MQGPRLTGPTLIGDIGGTNARFAIAAGGSFDRLTALHTGDHPTLLAAIRHYLSGLHPTLQPAAACLAIAGPVSGDAVALTNQNWSFSIAAMQAELGVAEMVVMNDFAATAMALPHLAEADRLKIGPGTPLAQGPIVVVGPGTGLGVGTLAPVPGGWLQLPGEGGHVTMPAATLEESRILDRLRARFDHVSAERVISGQGLVNLYEAICEEHGRLPRPRMPSEVTDAALSGADTDCVHALELFCAMLGTVAGDLALTLGATGGVYIAGGILPRFPERFASSSFRTRFEDKGRLRDFVAPIPTYLVVHPNTALLGLANL